MVTISIIIFFLTNIQLVYSAEVNSPEIGAVQNYSYGKDEYYRMKNGQNPSQESPIIDSNDTKQQEKQEESDITVLIKKIEIDQSEILSSVDLQAITSKYENRKLSIKELKDLVEEINQLYAQKKITTAKAILPPQKIINGIVQIRLIEAHVGEVRIEDNKFTRSSYFYNRINLASGDLVNLNDLEEELIYFNRTNDVQVRLELQPGSKAGTTDCILRVLEPDRERYVIFTDNGGNKTNGIYRRGLTMVNNSLSKRRDSLSITGIWSEGNTAGSASYELPINNRGTRLGVFYSKNQSTIISGPFESLDISGDVSDLALTLNNPLTVSPNYKLDNLIELHNKKSSTSFSGTPLVKTDVHSINIGFAEQAFSNKSYRYTRHDFISGKADNSQEVRKFFRYNLSYVKQSRLFNNNILTLRLAGQLSNQDLLPSSEQFVIGGMSTVRGYPEGLLNGDQGYFLSAEMSFPFHNSEKAQGFVFLDHGGAFPYKGNNQGPDSNDFLTSVGLGANIKFSKVTSGKIVFGLPLSSPKEYDQKLRVHFFLQTLLN